VTEHTKEVYRKIKNNTPLMPMQKVIIELHYGFKKKPMPLEEIAEQLNMSLLGVSVNHDMAIRTMRNTAKELNLSWRGVNLNA